MPIESDVTIVGGGLAGVYAAYCCKQKGLSYTILESKNYLGGRIKSIPNPSDSSLHHDLGPTWVFPHHINMQNLIGKLERVDLCCMNFVHSICSSIAALGS